MKQLNNGNQSKQTKWVQNAVTIHVHKHVSHIIGHAELGKCRERERSAVICNIFQVYQAAAQAADTYSGEEDTTQREKSWFPVWDDARGEWTEQDN